MVILFCAEYDEDKKEEEDTPFRHRLHAHLQNYEYSNLPLTMNKHKFIKILLLRYLEKGRSIDSFNAFFLAIILYL